MVMVEEIYLSQHQSLALVEAEEPLLREVSVPAAAVHGENVCPARKSICFGCNKKGHFKTMCHSSRKTQSVMSFIFSTT